MFSNLSIDFEHRNFNEPLDSVTIDRTKIAKAIDKLKASKSQGPDQIHLKLLKECKDTLSEPLEIILINRWKVVIYQKYGKKLM